MCHKEQAAKLCRSTILEESFTLILIKFIQIDILIPIKEAIGLIITRETDYALRMLRALQDGEKNTISDLARKELIPQQFAYKILKKLAQADLVTISRGAEGGCRLRADLNSTTLYDVMAAVEERGHLSACMDPAYRCPWRESRGHCALHCRLGEIQQRLNEELRAHSLHAILASGVSGLAE